MGLLACKGGTVPSSMLVPRVSEAWERKDGEFPLGSAH